MSSTTKGTGVKVGQLPEDTEITGTEKVLISDDGESKYATIDRIKDALKDKELNNKVDNNTEAITYLTNKINNMQPSAGDEESDIWMEYND